MTPLPAFPLMQRARALWQQARWTQRATLFCVYAMIFTFAAVTILTMTNATTPAIALSAGALYLLSHLFRAFRLAALSVDALSLSARTTASMHFATAPFSLLLPFKLGEVVRFLALYKMGGNAVNAVIVLLLDRMFDSLFLVPILVLLFIYGQPSTALALFTILAAAIPLLVVFVGPRILGEIQRYIVLSPDAPVTMNTLRRLDSARRMVVHASQVALRQAPQLSVLSLLIWLCEFGVCAIILMNADILFLSALDLLGARLVEFWSNTELSETLGTAVTITLMAQLLLWPWMTLVFLDRLQFGSPKCEENLAINPKVVA